MKVKITALLAAALLTSALLCGCGSPKEETPPAAPEDETSAGLIISKDTEDEFCVIRGDMSSDAETKSALRLKQFLSDGTGCQLKISTDWERNPVYRYEVIVGDTLRPSRLGDDIDLRSVGRTGFIVKCVGGRLYVGGGSAEGTERAVQWVIDNLPVSDGAFEVEDGFEHVEAQHYDLKGIYVCGESSADWPIVYAISSLHAEAKRLQSLLYDATGVWHETKEGAYDGAAFKIGFEKPETKGLYVIKEADGSLCFDSSAHSAEGLIEIFAYEYLDYSGNINFPEGYRYIDLGDNLIVGGLE